jgi:hypothetical protein
LCGRLRELATSSVPIFFHPQDEKYIDGGLIANNPTTDAIIDMYDYAKKDRKNLKLKLVLSLGCGLIKPECIEDIDFEPNSCGESIGHIMDMLDKHKLGEHAGADPGGGGFRGLQPPPPPPPPPPPKPF